ncbi:probable LRR receptor-like serine/threonine-protein kinase At3g47570 isoform X1 [Prunus persica]|nr:probable LRR receptor-like serine/threonine-protein kinase At3g47570 isoform X1 [Prunus persica]
MLERLHLEGNEFQGTIPQSLQNLSSLEEIDLSRNNLSGQIPEFLGKLSFLKNLNLSHNDFVGEIPKDGIFSNASSFSVLRNDKLCGGIPELLLHACSNKKPHSSRGVLVPKDWRLGVTYSELVESTDGFSVGNLIGSGSFGSVYKGVLPSDGTVVAVKVLNLQQEGASESLIDECKALKSIRHRNLLNIITACSTIDYQGNDFKSLVIEFMKNGSLDTWLHPRDDGQSESSRMTLIFNIAIDVASASDYLHKKGRMFYSIYVLFCLFQDKQKHLCLAVIVGVSSPPC